MLLMWGFGLVMLLALTFINFQEQTISVLAPFLEWLVQLPLVGERIATLLSGESTDTHITTGDFESFVLSAWAFVSLLFMLAGMVMSAWLGPFQPWSLKRKILIAGAAVVLLLAGMVLNYYAVPGNFNGEASGWMLNFSLISLLVFGVSAYCLSVAHFLGYLNESLMAGDLNRADDSGVIH